MNSINKKIFVFSLVFLVFLMPLTSAASGFRTENECKGAGVTGICYEIDHGDNIPCFFDKKITNTHPTNNYFIPVKTNAEFTSFTEHPPEGVTITDCAVASTCYTVASSGCDLDRSKSCCSGLRCYTTADGSQYPGNGICLPTSSDFTSCIPCAEETNPATNCNFVGTGPISYGTGTSFNVLTKTNTVECSNSVFGDPIFGTVKQCYIGDCRSFTATAEREIIEVQAPSVVHGQPGAKVNYGKAPIPTSDTTTTTTSPQPISGIFNVVACDYCAADALLVAQAVAVTSGGSGTEETSGYVPSTPSPTEYSSGTGTSTDTTTPGAGPSFPSSYQIITTVSSHTSSSPTVTTVSTPIMTPIEHITTGISAGGVTYTTSSTPVYTYTPPSSTSVSGNENVATATTDSDEDGGGSGSGKVICTEAHRLGYISDKFYAADQKYAEKVANKAVMLGYHSWAVPLVKAMQKDYFLSVQVIPIAVAWSEHSAYMEGITDKDNEIGKIILNTAIPLCEKLGDRMIKENMVNYEFNEKFVVSLLEKYKKPYAKDIDIQSFFRDLNEELTKQINKNL